MLRPTIGNFFQFSQEPMLTNKINGIFTQQTIDGLCELVAEKLYYHEFYIFKCFSTRKPLLMSPKSKIK